MAKRTEEEILSQAPIIVVLGGKDYKVKPLVIREAREWRQKVVAVIAKTPDFVGADTDTPESFEAALKWLLVTMQDTILDLFFEYAKDLNREEIEGLATEEEVADAFSRIVEVAFPLARSLPELRERLFR